MSLVSMFKQQLNEGDAVVLRMYNVLISKDVIGQVIESSELDNYYGNGKHGKKKPLKQMDLEPDKEQSANIASKISTASKFSAHEEFLTKYQFRNIDELIDLPKVCKSVNNHLMRKRVGGIWDVESVIKVVRGDEVLDLEDKDTSASIKGTNGFFCKTCNITCSRAELYDDSNSNASTTSQRSVAKDEIKSFLDCRYLSACESVWRIYMIDIHHMTTSVERLSFHLPGENVVVYNKDADNKQVLQ
ncbi:hypothetical protein Tco_0586245 [Tanacetum coccineum]